MRILAFIFFSLISSAQAAKVEYVEGEVLVRYRNSATVTAKSQLVQTLNAKKMKELPRRNTVLLKLPKGETVGAAVQKIQMSPEVEMVQPNYIYRANATVPNDTLYSSLWGLKNTGQTITTGTLGPGTPTSTNNPGTSGMDMDLELAWDKISNCGTSIVAVIDTGVRYTHNDLAANMWAGGGGAPNHGWDVQNGDNDPADDHGHGTHVAGTIGAVGNNGAGTTGVCWTVQIMAIKALDSSGAGTSVTVATGVDWAVANGAHIINMSLGSGASDATLEASLEAARVAGLVVITAAGNSGTNNTASPVYPCNYRKANMVCVAAVTQTYAKASFSNYSTTYVDVGAPGTNIVSPWPYSFTKVNDDFTAGWTIAGSGGTTGWGALTVSTYDTLAVPNNWNGGSSTYANSADEQAYKGFNLAGVYDKLLLEFGVLYNLGAAAVDSLRPYYDDGMVDPMLAGTVLATYTGQTSSSYISPSFDITSTCGNTNCSVGFRMVSNATGVDTGALILNFNFVMLTLANTSYNVIQGTSMAAPHVAGIAAMLKAYQTSYTALNIVDALKNGGDTVSSLSSYTSTGKVANAAGSLSYITAPTSVVLTTE